MTIGISKKDIYQFLEEKTNSDITVQEKNSISTQMHNIIKHYNELQSFKEDHIKVKRRPLLSRN